MNEENDDRFEDARQLWAGRFQGVLSTHSQAEPGYPFASVVPYCLDREGRALLLLSHLAQHTKNLIADPRCGISVAEAAEGDVQQTLRLSCLADCRAVEGTDTDAHGRWFRYYPDSRVYFEQLNFRLYRLQPKRFHYNGGFAAARWLGTERVLRPSPFSADEETGVLDELAGLTPSLAPPARLAGVDPWGLDLRHADRLERIPLPGPLDTPEALREVLLADRR